MGFLEDLGKFSGDVVDGVGKFGQDVLTGAEKFGQDAAHAVDQATRNTAQLAGSGVNAAGQITGPLGDMLGKDPQAFILNLTRKLKTDVRDLLKRVATRTGRISYEFPTIQGNRKIAASPASNADVPTLALMLALAAIDAPATMVEESGRQSAGLPVKPRGLTGYTVFPVGMSSGASGERGLFGIDDALLLAAAVPILIAIATAVLPGLISAVGTIVNSVIKGDQSKATAETQQAEAAAVAAEEKKKTTTTIAIVAAVVILGGGGLYLVLRKKK